MVVWLSIGLAIALPARADEAAARDVIETLNAALLGVMIESEVLDFAGRRESLRPVIEDSFDLPHIARLVAGIAWEGLEAAQRQSLIQRQTALTISTYAARFNSYSGETIEVLETRPMRRQRVLVKSELRSSDGDPVALDYVLHRVADVGRYRIINVLADGVSDLSIRRAQVAAVLRDHGFDTLLERLDAEVRALATTP